MSGLKKGYIQIYTGDGKGKTTAAVGLGVRAAGNGLKVIMVQFLKGGHSGELESAKLLEPNFKIVRFEKNRGFFYKLSEAEKKELYDEVQEAYNYCVSVMLEKKCDILILDEIMGTLSNGLVTEEQVLHLMEIKPDNIELVLTGRNVPDKIISKADLVTEMKMIKHYMDKGIAGRKGIEY